MSHSPVIDPATRLSATTVFGALSLATIIFGIGFKVDNAAPLVPTLDVILTNTTTDDAPKRADFLAQANNQGGGDSEQVKRPRDLQFAQIPRQEDGIAPVPLRAQAPLPSERTPASLVTSTQFSPESAAKKLETEELDLRKLPTGTEILERSLKMARLAAEVEQREQMLAQRPKRKFVSASTREYEYAHYLRQWAAHVERVGNVNYPEKARAQSLNGGLVMTVVVRRDGSVVSVVINTPSHYATLNQAAQRIVKLAEPFPPLPRTKDDVDELHIIRTWVFIDGSMQNY